MSTTESEVQTDLFGELVAQLKSEIDGLEMIEKPSATRLTQGGRTLGYLRGSKRGASIEIPAGHGAYDKVLVKQGSDVPKVVKAVVKYAKLAETAATEKAAEKEKAAAEKKAKAAAEKAAKKEADAKAKAEAAAAAEPPADADGVVTEG